MFGTNGLIIWLLGGAGTFLLYSSISNQKPQDVLAKYLGSPTAQPTPISTWKDPNGSSSTAATSSVVATAVAINPHGQEVALPPAYAAHPQTYVSNV